jgi:hypothetical protein
MESEISQCTSLDQFKGIIDLYSVLTNVINCRRIHLLILIGGNSISHYFLFDIIELRKKNAIYQLSMLPYETEQVDCVCG